jgi:hypothetical protein
MKGKRKGVKLAVRGFFRVNVVNKKTRRIVGDSGWIENQITNMGLESCLLGMPAGLGGDVLRWMGLGAGAGATAPASDATSLPGWISTDYTSTAGIAVNASTQIRLTQTFDFPTSQSSVANVGIHMSNNSTGGSLVAGETFNSSDVATDQDVNVTYDLNYSTS